MAENRELGQDPANHETGKRDRSGRGRRVLAAILAVVAGCTVPLAVVSSWTRTLINDTDIFVETYAPVLETTQMQQLIVQELSGAIVDHLGLTPGGIAGTAVSETVAQVVSTDAARDAKVASLRFVHDELRSELLGEQGNLSVDDGRIQLRFEPFVATLQQRLSDVGVPFVDRLPEIDGGVTLLTVDPETVPRLKQGAGIVQRAATVLPWVGAALMLAALLVAPRRSRTLVTFGLSVALAVLAVGFAWAFGVEYGVSRLDGALSEVAQTVADLTSDPISRTLEIIAVSGAGVAAVAAVAGRRWRF